MKKLLLLFSLCNVMLCVSCDPPLNAKRAYWYVKNNTEQTLNLDNTLGTPIRSVAPGDSLEICGANFSSSEIVYFNYFGQTMEESFGEDAAIKVLSEDDILLKEFRYADRNAAGKQFFKESSWRHYQIPLHSQEFNGMYIWVFDILPEDISSE